MKKLLITLIITCTVLIGIHPGQTAKNSIETDSFGYPIQTVSPVELRKLLLARQYRKLNTLLQTYQGEVEKDIRQEFKLLDAYNAVARAEPLYESYLQEWVRVSPKVYQPYLARGNYYYNMGWESRGYAWAKDTGPERFRRMEQFFAKALQDLNIVVKMYPKSLPVYDLLIGLHRGTSNRTAIRRACYKGLEMHPHSFALRAEFIHSLRPRWGGSYKAMDSFATEAQKYIRANPRLVLLRGYAVADQADLATYDDKYAEAINLYRRALSLGDFWQWHHEMALAYFYWDKNTEALVAVDKAIAMRPQVASPYALRAEIHYLAGRIQQSLADIDMAREIAGRPSEYRDRANWIAGNILSEGYDYYEAKNYDKAITRYDLAKQFDPEYGELYYWRARAYVDLKDLARARTELDTAIRLDPTNLDSYLLMDWLLAKDKRWDEIIAYWTRLIELQPKNARAYLERGGAYYHKGDMQAALRDAKKAGDLGNSEGRRMYEMLRSRSG